MLTLLNAGVEQVVASLQAITLKEAVVTAAGQNVVVLPADVGDILRLTWSDGDPTTAGAIEYPLQQLERLQFDVFAGGVPGVGMGPPSVWTIISDESNVYTIQVYPGTVQGQINIYYHARPTVWADALTSMTNLDTSLQEAAIVWACWKVAQTRGRYQLGKMFMDEYTTLVQSYKDRVRRRTVPRSGRVTDVSSMGFPGVPPWLR